MIKAVLIDIDNTLLDFDAYVKESMKEGFKKFDLGTYEDYMYQVFERINTRMWQEIERGELTYDELLKSRWNRIFAELDISFDGTIFETYFKDCLFNSAIPVEGSLEILEYLSKRYILCAASNGPYEQQVNRLKRGNLFSYFSKLFISEKIGVSKPSEKFFSHCLNELGNNIRPSEVIMIGDSLTSDITGAIQSGLKTCFFDRNMRGKIDDLSIDHVINKLTDIRAFL